MSKLTNISSFTQLDRILKSYLYCAIDFTAEWCGPCKAIGPVFDALASEHAKPGKLAFVKVDVDSQQAIAKKYGVSAMPTFLVLKRDTVINSLRGADPAALRRMITDAAAAADKSVSASFQSPGNVLGSDPSDKDGDSTGKTKPAGSRGRTVGGGSWRSWFAGFSPYMRRGGDSWYIAFVRFVILYLTTLFSLDPVASVRASPYRKND